MTAVRPVSALTGPALRPASPAGSPASRSEAYRGEAGRYDQRTDAFRQWCELLIQRLPVRRGDTVLDVGCGTGLCLPLLQHKVGPTGAIIGIDASEQMLRVAADRIAEHGWDNVALIAAPVATAPIKATADAAVFCAVHDLMQCPAALGNVFDHLRPGAGGRRGRRQMAGPVDVATAGMGHPAAYTVHHRLHRLRPAVATVGPIRLRPPSPGTGLRRRIPRPRTRPRLLNTRIDVRLIPGSMAGNPAEYSAAQ